MPLLPSDTLNNHGSLTFKLDSVLFSALLLTIFQPTALMILQHAMLATKVAVAETTVTYNALSAIFAVLEVAFYLLGWHSAANW